jgi:hypothetical protein
MNGRRVGAGGRPLYGLLAEFGNVEDLIAGAERVRDAGYTRWDAHAPFPVHGLDDAMGIRPTRLPYLVFAAGAAGAFAGLALQWWTNAADYPLVISGKPLFALPAAVPVMFELTILFAALAAFVGMLAFNDLPLWYHALFRSERFRRATNDRFFISIEARDPKFDPETARALLASLRGATVEEVEE